MWILASYTDKDKENVYETPGFNKTKNLNLLLVFLFLSHVFFSKTSEHKTIVFVAFITHFPFLNFIWWRYGATIQYLGDTVFHDTRPLLFTVCVTICDCLPTRQSSSLSE